MANLNWNGVGQPDTHVIGDPGAYNGNISIPGVTWVRPEAGPGSTTGAGQWAFLNPAAGCLDFPEVHPVGVGSVPILNGVPTSCEVNFQSKYIMIQPVIKRHGVSARATWRPDDNNELFVEGNAYWTDTFASFTPLGFNGTPTPPIPATLGAYNVMLPVWVCPAGIGTRNGAQQRVHRGLAQQHPRPPQSVRREWTDRAGFLAQHPSAYGRDQRPGASRRGRRQRHLLRRLAL